MASETRPTIAAQGDALSAARPGRFQSLLLPSIAEWAFVAVLAWLFFGAAGAQALLGDGDTGWHIRTGEYVLENGALPPTDPFSFTMEGREWFAWEWLADVILAAVYRWDGLEGVVLLAGAVIGLACWGALRYLLWLRVNIFLAVFGMLLISGVTTSHWLARPHMFTWVFFLITLWLLEADRRENTRRVWLLVPLVAAWVNIHGGFMALLLTVAVFGFGVGLEQAFDAYRLEGRIVWRIPRGWLRYGSLFAACAAATLANPYGYHLHEHIGAYLQSDFILNSVQEFQAPAFRSEAEKIFEAALLGGLLTAGFLMRRGEFAWPLVIAAWAHATLTSFRHGALFMMVAVPVIAVQLSRWIEEGARAGSSFLQILQDIADDYGPSRKAGTESGPAGLGWLPAAAVVCLAYLLNAKSPDDVRWRAEFPALLFPAKAADALGDRLLEGRVLTSDQWGDYLVYRYYPRYKTFIDGRSDFYDPAVRDDYVRILSAHFEWEDVVDKYEFDAVLAPLDWSLTAALKRSREWRLIYDDGMALYFERAGETPESAKTGGSVEAQEPRMALGRRPEFAGDPLRAP